jgi:hypothetical protein
VNARALALMWVGIGVLIWNVIFDLHILYAARDYLYLAAEAELGRAQTPSMSLLMRRARRTGALSASGWTLLVVGAGWATIWLARRPRRRSGSADP